MLQYHSCKTSLIIIIIQIIFYYSIPFDSKASDSKYEDVIYFHNGRILRGEIIEKEEDYLKIEITGRNVEVVMMEDIKEISKEVIPDKTFYKKKGYVNFTGIDKLYGGYDWGDVNPVRIITVNGIQINSIFFTGIGTGLVKYVDPFVLVPVFADFNLKFSEKNAAPYVFMRGGYSISLQTSSTQGNNLILKHRGGWIFSTGLGIQIHTSRDFGWYINGGFNMDHIYYEVRGWGDRVIINENSYRRLFLGMGFVF